MSTMYSSCTEYRRLFLRIFPIPLLLTHKKITRFTCIVLQHLKYFLHFMNYQCPFSIACLQSVCLHADHCLIPGTHGSLHQAHNFLKDPRGIQRFMLHSPSTNSFRTSLSHQYLLRTHIQNICVVHGGINRIRLWAFRPSAEWLDFSEVCSRA